MVTTVGWMAAGSVMLRGVTGTRNVVSSLAWLMAGQPSPACADQETSGPHFVLIVPMLREQGLISGATARFSGLAASWGEASVAIVTTEREHAERRLARDRLPPLVEALSRGRTVGRFLGVLPQDRLDALASWAGRPAGIPAPGRQPRGIIGERPQPTH